MDEKHPRVAYSAIYGLAAATALVCGISPAQAAPGDLLATVTLPGNGDSVGGSTIPGGPSGIVYIAPRNFVTQTWDVYDPPAGLGPQVAALLSTKTLVDAGNNPVAVSCGTWDSTRNVLWVANAGIPGSVYSVDLGDLTVSGDAVATFEFDSNVGGISLCDGIAYDPERDTLWISPDVNQSVYEYDLGGNFTGFGTQIRAVSPQNAAGQADGLVSGVTVGSNNTLYIGRNGAQEIRRVDKDTGAFISQFAQTVGRAEDLSCDPVTYDPLEAIIAKEAFGGFYEAFEVEEGTCPLPGLGLEVPVDIKPQSCRNPLNTKSRGVLPGAILGTSTFDVTQVDVSTVLLAGVAPLRSAIEDVAKPFEPFIGKEDAFDCTDEGPDGFDDLTLKFDSQAIVAALEADFGPLVDGQVVVVPLTGNLLDGTPFTGEDVVVILKK